MKRNQNITCTMDYVADVLKTVANNGQPKKQDVDKAISQHNDKVGGLKDLEYGGKTVSRCFTCKHCQNMPVIQITIIGSCNYNFSCVLNFWMIPRNESIVETKSSYPALYV